MSEASTCPACGGPLPPQLSGLCPRCLAKDLQADLEGSLSGLPNSRTQAAEPAGERFGKYIKVQKLDLTDTDETWRAWDTSAGRWYQLKILRRAGKPGPSGSSLAQRSGPAEMAAVHESGEIEGQPYLALHDLEPSPKAGSHSRPAAAVRKPSSAAIHDLGGYRLLRKLGEGGMGAVYLAEDTRDRSRVAVKVLPKELLKKDSTALKRFQRESAAMIRLHHPHLVRAFASGEDRGHPFYVMEYCEGESLESLLKRDHFLPWRKAVDLLIPLAGALEYAHRMGFVHRDVKPSNILIAPDGTPKLLDLGISKYVGRQEISFRTETGIVIGTPHYISPEQARAADKIDGRADIYSLGATLYHLITGRPPFTAASPMEILAQHQHARVPDPRAHRKHLPEPVARLLIRMLAKDPRDRHRGCGALVRDLKRVRDGKRALLDPLPLPLQGRLPFVLAGGALLAISLLLIAFLAAGNRPPAESPAVPARVKVTPAPSTGSPVAVQFEDGLVGYWKLDEVDSSDGEVARDSSGHGNDGRYRYGPSPFVDTPTVDFPNPRSRFFDSRRTQHVVVPGAPSLRLTESFTLAVWIRPSLQEIKSQFPIIEKYDVVDDYARGGYFLRLHATRTLAMCTSQTAGPGTGVSTEPRAIPLNVWTHVAGVYDQTSKLAKLYVNGKLDRIAKDLELSRMEPPSGSSSELHIGRDYGLNAFQGGIDEVRIYNRALSGEEVQELAFGSLHAQPEATATLLSRLASPDERSWEHAKARLSRRGPSIVPSLEISAGDPSSLISSRAKDLLESFTKTFSSPVPASLPTPEPKRIQASAEPPRPPDKTPEVIPGLLYEYYEGFWNLLPDFDAFSPKSRGTTETFEISKKMRKDGFGFRFRGFIDVPKDGDYTFTTASDDGSKLYIGDWEVVSNDGARGLQERSGTVSLLAGKHSITVTFFEAYTDEILEVYWQGPGFNREKIPASVLFRNPPTLKGRESGPPAAGHGLAYEYYEGLWTKLPDFSQLTPVDRGITDRFGIDQRNRDDAFGFRFTGSIDIPTAGKYTFYLLSDDGSRLLIGGNPIVDNDGAHAATEASGTVELSAGKHPITVLYFEYLGGETLEVSWSGPGIPRQHVPPKVLHPPAPGTGDR